MISALWQVMMRVAEIVDAIHQTSIVDIAVARRSSAN